MLHDWSQSASEPEKFPFWSRMELLRVGVIAALAIIPMSVAAIDAPKQKPASLARDAEPAAVPQPGRLLSTRHIDFDIKALDLTSLGDAEPDKTR